LTTRKADREKRGEQRKKRETVLRPALLVLGARLTKIWVEIRAGEETIVQGSWKYFAELERVRPGTKLSSYTKNWPWRF